MRTNPTRVFILIAIVIAVVQFSSAAENWQGTWASAQMLAETKDLPELPLHEVTLRQNIRISCGGNKLRVRLSNEFGDGPLEIGEATLAFTEEASVIRKGTAKPLKFGGHMGISIAAGKAVTSDPFSLRAPALSRLTITLYVKSAPKQITAHPGSRTTSYLLAGNHVTETALESATKTDHWYFIAAVEVASPHNAGAIAILGDSITDGRGST